jgi:hypothetical protein
VVLAWFNHEKLPVWIHSGPVTLSGKAVESTLLMDNRLRALVYLPFIPLSRSLQISMIGLLWVINSLALPKCFTLDKNT